MRLAHIVLFVSLAANARTQTLLNTDTIGTTSAADNIYSLSAFSDSLSSSFVICINKKVAPHKHVFHSEHVLVLDGEGEMLLGEKAFSIKKGDLVFIPQNTVHAVTTKGNRPLRVLSVQAPRFDGSDRVMVPEGK